MRRGKPIRIICFGAHPDDAEYKSGGSAALWAQAGHEVKLVSVTNGDIGHWAMAGGPLASRHYRIAAWSRNAWGSRLKCSIFMTASWKRL
ncbi:MAG: PIG-L family deacetylase [Pirellulaceae bacterium]